MQITFVTGVADRCEGEMNDIHVVEGADEKACWIELYDLLCILPWWADDLDDLKDDSVTVDMLKENFDVNSEECRIIAAFEGKPAIYRHDSYKPTPAKSQSPLKA